MKRLDPEAVCPKCGSEDVRMNYHKNAHIGGCCLEREIFYPACCQTEHIERTCQRCHYGWAERPAGARKKASAS